MSATEQPVSVSSPASMAAAPGEPVAVAAPRRTHSGNPGVLEMARSLLSVVVIALFILTFIVQPFRIPSESMEHTLLVGDFLLVNKIAYAPAGIWKWLMPYRQIHRGDIVVFHYPPNPPEHVVKRVIGLPGDHIHLENGRVYVDGQRIREPDAHAVCRTGKAARIGAEDGTRPALGCILEDGEILAPLE